MISAGDIAPDFELKDGNGNTVKLSTFKGKKVLLAFFPFAFSPVCTDEMSCFKTDIKKFEDRGVQILGISVDSHWSLKAFGEKIGMTFPLLSDFEKKTVMAYGVFRAEGFSNRAYFLIDEKGVIRYKHIMNTPGERLNNQELLKEVAK